MPFAAPIISMRTEMSTNSHICDSAGKGIWGWTSIILQGIVLHAAISISLPTARAVHDLIFAGV